MYYCWKDPRVSHVPDCSFIFHLLHRKMTTTGSPNFPVVSSLQLNELSFWNRERDRDNGDAFGNGDASDENGVVCSERLDFNMFVYRRRDCWFTQKPRSWSCTCRMIEYTFITSVLLLDFQLLFFRCESSQKIEVFGFIEEVDTYMYRSLIYNTSQFCLCVSADLRE